MENLSLLANMALVLGLAFFAGLMAYRLRMPVIIGYLICGVVIGPHLLGLISDTDDVETLATVGVVLLMFTIGMEFSLKTLRIVGKIAVVGGIAQVVITALLGLALACVLGEAFQEAVLFGFFISLSSTAIVLKILMDRGELGTPHGQIMIGILLIQDLSVVPMMAIIPSLGDTGTDLLADVAFGLLKATIFLGATFTLGWWGFPWFMKWVVGGQSRELFLLAIVCICFGAGFASDYFGLSVALGAFLAGLLISESEYAHQAIADIRPLRDTFAVLFFVSLGMLADPEFIEDNAGEIAFVVLAVIVGKAFIMAVIPRCFGYSAKTSLLVGSGLFQIGEFSFILAALALEEGHISEDVYDLTLATAFITILLTPFGLGAMSRGYYGMMEGSRVLALLGDRPDPELTDVDTQMSNHAVICGYGRATRNLLEALQNRNFSYVVIDIDPRNIALARQAGIPCIFGDPCHAEVLAVASLERARVMIIAISDPIVSKLTAQNARRINRRLDIVAQVHRDEDVEVLLDMGVSEIVRPEVEAGLEIIHHTLHRFGVTPQETRLIVSRLREKEVLRRIDPHVVEPHEDRDAEPSDG